MKITENMLKTQIIILTTNDEKSIDENKPKGTSSYQNY